jgi:hypothetical protein
MGSLSKFASDIAAYTQIDTSFAKILSYFVHGVTSSIEVEGMKTNIFLFIPGPSSISHKSTAAAQAIKETISSSPLGTLAGMEEVLEGTTDHVFYSDEFGMVLKGMKSGNHAYSTIIDVLNSLYDGKPYQFPKRKGRGAKVNAKVSLLATTTPEAFTEHCNREMLEGGLFKRMLVCVVGRQPYKSRRNRPESVRLQMVCDDWKMEFTPWRVHEKFMREHVESGDDFTAGCWQRGEEYIFKLSAIHAACERESMKILLEDWKDAVSVVSASVTWQLMLRAMLGYGNLDRQFAAWGGDADTKV